jgi:hypothetical protein
VVYEGLQKARDGIKVNATAADVKTSPQKKK